MSDKKIVVGITQGDINGIGYEVIIKTLSDTRINEICIPIIYGSPKVAGYHRKALNMENFSLNQIRHASEANPKRSNIVNCMDDSVRVELGKPTEQGGEGAIASLKTAVADMKEGLIDVLVTAPISKQNVKWDGNFAGHTEYLAHAFDTKDVLMLMTSDVMRVGVLTGHVPLKQVSGLTTIDSIVATLRLFNSSLLKDFRIPKPRIAVLGLNPHAGDQGVLGDEEIDAILPALQQANEEGIVALGPYPSDGFFGSDSYGKFDGILAIYHDQGLIPFKAMSYGQGVNFTAGLPVVRTSPAHGTAFDIAGEGIASPDSFRQALYLALDVYRNRELYDVISKNPLEVTPVGNDRRSTIE